MGVIMFTKIVKKLLYFKRYMVGHCVPEGGSTTGHCY